MDIAFHFEPRRVPAMALLDEAKRYSVNPATPVLTRQKP
jgi:hypothetical protein